MGPVTSHAVEVLKKQVAAAGLVVWLDPDRTLAAVIEPLRSTGVTVEEWKGSHFEFRKRLEPALAGDAPGKVVAYLPCALEAVALPLAELLAAGVVVRPRHNLASRNTSLAILARSALAPRLSSEALEKILEQVEKEKLSLAELDALGEKAPSAVEGVLAVIYKVTTSKDLAIAFICGTATDGELQARGGLEELKAVLAQSYAWNSQGALDVVETRKSFIRHVLSVDLAAACPDDALEHLPRLKDEALVETCVDLASTWRQRADLRETYLAWAASVEKTLQLDHDALPPGALVPLRTFKVHELALQGAMQKALLGAVGQADIDLAVARLSGFWAAVDGELMNRWALIASVARLLQAADEVEVELGRTAKEPRMVAEAYTRELLPWSRLDTIHRQTEQLAALFDFDPGGADLDLEKLLAKARLRHTSVAGRMARTFVDGLADDGLDLEGFPRQLETFERFVKPAISSGKTAYLLVDGLRYEMARELQAAFGALEATKLQVTIGTLPSITEVGMAALMPNAHAQAELVPVGPGRVGLSFQGRTLASRKDRLEYLEEIVGIPVYTAQLESLLPAKAKVREAIKDAALVVVTATDELDGICETGNVALARRLMHDVLQQLVRATRVLHGLGVESVVITADHGFLFGETIDSGGKIDPPGGVTHDLHRRAWVGIGGAASESIVRFSARQAGLEGNLEIAVPRSLGCFKVAGGTLAYFHGGASPQELLVPVLVVKAARQIHQRGSVTWSLMTGSKSISSRFVSVQVSGAADGLFRLHPTRVLVELREGKTVLSRAVSASYGFDQASGGMTLDPSEDGRTFKPDTVTLLLEQLPAGAMVTVALVDAESERTVKTIDAVPVKLAGF